MSNPGKSSFGASSPSWRIGTRAPRVLEAIAFAIVVGVVALRPLVSESYESTPSTITRALGDLSDATPTRTLLFDVAILVSACLWLVSRAIGAPRAYRRTGLEWGGLLIAVAAAASCVTAGNKRLAINGAIDWLCQPVLAIVLVQTLRTGLSRRVLLAAIVASACVQAVQCWDESLSGQQQTWDHYQTIKADFWAKQGVPLDSDKVTLFERRMQSREAQGFMPHANVAGSYLALCGLAALGVVLGRVSAIKRNGGALLSAAGFLVAFVVLAAVLTTKSLGAAVAAAAASVVWIGATRFRPWIDAHRRGFAFAVWAVVAAVGIGTVAYGLLNDRLPGWSLTFRWQYWTASAPLIVDHWLTGVGRENFGRHYLQYKSIQSPEEISNPHNLIVQAASDWGVLGAVGLVVLLVYWPIALAKRPEPVTPETSVPKERVESWLWTLLLLGVVTLGRVPMLGTEDPNYVYFVTVMTGAVWLLAFRVFVGMPCLLSIGGAVAGIAAFLLHDTINFALWVPATATTLFALMAWTLAGDDTADASPSLPTSHTSSMRWAPPVLGFFALGMVLLTAVIPTMRCLAYLDRARVQVAEPLQGAYGDHPAWASLQAAAAADVWDPTPHRAQAEWLMSISGPISGDQLERLLFAAKTAIEAAWIRDRNNVNLQRLDAEVSLRIARSTKTREDFLEAISAFGRVLMLYPRNPPDWVRYADMQLEAAEATSTDSLRTEAAMNYERALDLDDQRLSWEEFHRLSAAEKEAIGAKIRRARGQ